MWPRAALSWDSSFLFFCWFSYGLFCSLHIGSITPWGWAQLYPDYMLPVGVLSTIAHSQRYVFYWRRSQIIREYLDSAYMDGLISELYSKAKVYRSSDWEQKKWPHWLPPFLNHHYIWLLIHSLVFIGTICFLYSIVPRLQSTTSKWVQKWLLL